MDGQCTVPPAPAPTIMSMPLTVRFVIMTEMLEIAKFRAALIGRSHELIDSTERAAAWRDIVAQLRVTIPTVPAG